MENRPVTDHLPIKDIDKLTNDDFPVRYCVSWPEGFHLVWWLNPLMFHHFHSFPTIFIGSILISVAFLWHLGRRILKDRPESSVVVTEARDRAGVAWGWREGSGFPHENMGFRWFQQQHMVWIYVFLTKKILENSHYLSIATVPWEIHDGIMYGGEMTPRVGRWNRAGGHG